MVIIIGILAAIAIPTFLNQRKKGWESAVKSDLRNYAILLETHLTDAGTYASPASPTASSPDVNLTVPPGTSDTYFQAFHSKNSSDIWSLRPGAGGLTKSSCAAGTSGSAAS